MKIKSKSNKPVILIAILAIAIVVGGAGVYTYAHFFKPSTVAQNAVSEKSDSQQSGIVNYDSPTSDQQSAGSTTKEQAASQSSTDSSSQSSIKVTIQPATSRLTVLLNLVTNTGTCTLTLTGPSSPGPVTANIQAQSSYSVCEGFDTSSLAAGNWTAKVDVQSGSQTGTATQIFTVQ